MPCLPHPEAAPCLYPHSNHILRSAFQDFSRHDAPMHRCSRAPELTSRASVTGPTPRQSSSHQSLLRKVRCGTARDGTVLQCAALLALPALPASPVDGTNALPPPRIVSSYRPTPGHLQHYTHVAPYSLSQPIRAPSYPSNGIRSRLPGSQSP